jgi:sulfite reductase alpha subunit-like flavoprotein
MLFCWSLALSCWVYTCRCDLVSMPKKSVVTKLANCCTNAEDAKTLIQLTGKSDLSKQLWVNYIEGQHVGIGEVILMFPSCVPTIQQLIELLVPMPPRYYSIASSPYCCSDTTSSRAQPSSCSTECTVAFSVVRYTCGLGLDKNDRSAIIHRFGLCTSYLEDLVGEVVKAKSAGSKCQPTIRVFHKSTINFHLPGNVSHPLILIGPGEMI